MRMSTRCRHNKWRTLAEGGIKVFLMLFLLSFFTTTGFGQAASSPCTAHRWNSGEAWSRNTTGLWTGIPATGQTQPQGVVGCASAAATESGLEVYKGKYNPADFAITGLSDCFSMSTNTFGNELAAPEAGEDIVWFNFDIRPLAGTYQFQVVSNEAIGWALYYVDPADARPNASDPGPTYPLNPVRLSGNCSNLKPANIMLGNVSHGNCGLQGNGWSTITVPSFNKPTNYYLAMWLAPTGTGVGKSTFPGSINLVYKARYGCGGSTCTIEKIGDPAISCLNGGTGGYQVCQQFGGSAGRWQVQDMAATKATSYTITTYKQDQTTVVSTQTYSTLTAASTVTLGIIPDGAVYAKVCATYGIGQPYNIMLVPDPTYSGASGYITCGDGAGFDGSSPTLPSVKAAAAPSTLNLATGNTSALSAVASGGAGSFTYAWTPATPDAFSTVSNANTANATFTINTYPVPLPTNYDFQVVATDALGCNAKDPAQVIIESTLEPCGIYGPGSVCEGATNLTYTFGADGTPYTLNTTNYSYKWSISGNGTIVGEANNTGTVIVNTNGSGSFTLTMTIKNITGIQPDRICQFTTTVTAPPAVPTLGKVDPTCALATGCVTITSSTAGLTFSLDGGEYASYPSGGWCGLAAGSTHSVTVKNEAGCVSGPASITLASQPQSPAVPTLGKVDPTCALATGCVTITSSTAGLTFSLDGGEYASYPSGGWCGLAAGSTHSVTVKNEAGCVSGPASITLASQPQSPAVPTLGKVDPTCALATGCVTITSSTAGLTFSLDGGEYASYPSGGWCGLAAGSTHSVTVKNEAGCVSGPASITLASQPQSPAVPTLGKVDPTCALATGCVTITSSTAGLTFSLDGGEYASYPSGGWCGLAAGSTHSVTVKNEAGCVSGPASITLASQPQSPAVPTLGKVDPTCALATGCVTITSSTAGLTFSLDGGEYASYPSGGWCGLAAGSTHSVTVKNEAGCVSGPASITLASQPQSPAVPTLGKVDPTCALATGCVTITSSTAGLTFSLDGGEYASYPSGGWCGLAAGSTHSVTVKNEAGCVSGPASITLASQPQSPAVPTLGKVDPTCALATGCVTITSSTAGLTFSLDGGEYASYPSGGWCGLAAGSTHSVTVKNEAGCVSGPASITLASQPQSPAVPTLGKVDPTCALATGCVTITSSTAGLTFSLDGGEYASYPSGGWCGLAAGSTHSVTVKNEAGCVSGPASITLASQPQSPAVPTLGKVDPTCALATGCVTITSSTAGLTFSLDGGEYASYPSGGWCGLAAGSTHSVTVKNEAGCVSGPASITLASQPQSPAVPTLGKVDPTCALATGCVTITSSTAGLTFSLDGGEYASYPSGGWCGLAAGSTHSVTVKNEAGCVSGPASITLASQPQSPAVPTLGKVDPTCALATGCVTITSSTAGLTFSLDGGEYASYPSGGWCGLAAGSTHSVTVKNEAGCVSGPASITLASQPQSPAVPTLGKVDPTCALATGCVTITSSTAGLTFSLDGGEYASYPSGGWCGLAAGSTHSVTVKNEAGCVSGPASITLASQPQSPAVPTLGKVDPTCALATGCVTITSSTAGLTFSLDGGEYASYPSGGWCGLAAGSTHSVTVKNEAGCVSGPASITLASQPQSPAVPTLGKVDPTCALATGCVTITSSTAGLTLPASPWLANHKALRCQRLARWIPPVPWRRVVSPLLRQPPD